MLAYLLRADMGVLIKLTTLLLPVVLIWISRLVFDKYPQPRLRSPLLVVGAIASATIVTVAWALQFDSVQISDFGVYLRCGTEVDKTIVHWVDSCQSEYLHKNLIYWSRSLLYSTPLGFIVGANYTIFKLYNALLHAGTITLWFLGLRHYYGTRIALIAALILFLYPEWWFTVTLVTGDNLAVLCIISFILVLPKLHEDANAFWIIGCLTIVLFAANLLRSIGVILVFAMVGWVCHQQCEKWKPILIVRALGIILIYGVLNCAVGYFTKDAVVDPSSLLKALSSIDFFTKQDFGSSYLWGQHYWFSIPEEWRAEVAFEKIKLEVVYGATQWPIYLYNKAAVLFSGVGYYDLSTIQNLSFNPDTIFTVPKNTVPIIPVAPKIFSSMVYVCLTLTAWSIFVAPLQKAAHAAAFWLGSFFFFVAGLGEVQPRYSVLIAPSLSLLCAIALNNMASCSVNSDEAKSNRVAVNTAMGVLIIVLLFTTLAIAVSVAKILNHNPIFEAKKTKYVENMVNCADAFYKVELSYKRIRMITPAGVACASVILPLSKNAKSISFFVSESKIRYLWEPENKSNYHYQVMLDNQLTLLEADIGSQDVRWHRISLDGFLLRDSANVRLSVFRDKIDTEEAVNFDLYTENQK
jgi:hypothetical protein